MSIHVLAAVVSCTVFLTSCVARAADMRVQTSEAERFQRGISAAEQLMEAARDGGTERLDFDGLVQLRRILVWSSGNIARADASDFPSKCRKFDGIQLLGLWRDPAGVRILLSEIEFSELMLSSPRSPLGWYPAANALALIGSPAAKVIVEERLERPVNDHEVRLFAWIIYLVDGEKLGAARLDLELKSTESMTEDKKANLVRLIDMYRSIDFNDPEEWPQPPRN